MPRTPRTDDLPALVAGIVERTGGDIRLALPLGLGKPVRLVNALVDAACADPAIRLRIFTALTLERPDPSSEVERRFLAPAMDRLFGTYPGLHYARMRRAGTLPDNIEVTEFFMLAGRWLGNARAQQDYVSANYTHALDVLVARRPNVVVQLVAERAGRVSLASNTDISTDLFEMRRRGELDFTAYGEVHPEMPFLEGAGAVLDDTAFAGLLDPEPYGLFSAPRRPVSLAKHAIGLHVSGLVPDGGTLQVGIGWVGDAVAHALMLRHRGDIPALQSSGPFPGAPATARFETGLYAVTEMLVGGLLALLDAGILRRTVDGHAIHAGFFVETRDFYAELRDRADLARQIGMRPVSFTNQLYGDETAKRAARTDARFVNGAMQVSLLGDAMSDAVADGQVVSGVGGQANFVEQALALDGAASILVLTATRMSGGRAQSNIRWHLPAVTIPRHMRDVVVTEYGVARLRGRSDAEVIAALLNIADSRFQPDLMAAAKAAGKLPKDHEIPEAHRRNLPETVAGWLAPHRDLLPAFPFGTDFTAIEQVLLPALERLGDRSSTLRGKLGLILSGLTVRRHPRERDAMDRMGWATGGGLTALALRGALRQVAGDA